MTTYLYEDENTRVNYNRLISQKVDFEETAFPGFIDSAAQRALLIKTAQYLDAFKLDNYSLYYNVKKDDLENVKKTDLETVINSNKNNSNKDLNFEKFVTPINYTALYSLNYLEKTYKPDGFVLLKLDDDAIKDEDFKKEIIDYLQNTLKYNLLNKVQ